MEKLQRAQTHWAQPSKVFFGPKWTKKIKISKNEVTTPSFCPISKYKYIESAPKVKKNIQTQKHWYSNPTEVDNTDEITNQTFNKDISLNTELK